MAPSVRRAVVDALGLQRTKEDDGGSSNDLQKLADLEGAQRDAAQHLVGLGFRPGQAVEAVATTSTNDALEATEKALAHLCFHVDESDLSKRLTQERREFRCCLIGRRLPSLWRATFRERWTTCARLAKPDASFEAGAG